MIKIDFSDFQDRLKIFKKSQKKFREEHIFNFEYFEFYFMPRKIFFGIKIRQTILKD